MGVDSDMLCWRLCARIPGIIVLPSMWLEESVYNISTTPTRHVCVSLPEMVVLIPLELAAPTMFEAAV